MAASDDDLDLPLPKGSRPTTPARETLEWDTPSPTSQGPIVRSECSAEWPRVPTPSVVSVLSIGNSAMTPTARAPQSDAVIHEIGSSTVSQWSKVHGTEVSSELDGGSRALQTKNDDESSVASEDPPRIISASQGGDVDLNPFAVDARAPLNPARPQLARRLATEVRAAMMKALRYSGTKRSDVLQDLFNNVIFDVEDVVLRRLGYNPEDTDQPALYYYNLLSEFYALDVEEAEDLQGICVTLWGNTNFAGVYALIFYRWLFLETYGSLNRYHVFVKGVNRLFWHDMNNMQYRFVQVFAFVRDNILLSADMWMRVPITIMKSLLGVTSKFFFYYDADSEPMTFLKQATEVMQSSVTETMLKSDFDMGIESLDEEYIVSVFVSNVSSQLHVMKGEQVLLLYMDRLQKLRGVSMEPTVHHKLLSALHRFTIPGGPLYPPRSLRNAASATMDSVFPEGRMIRRGVNIWFRLLHPYYWVSSFTHWLCSGMKRTVRNAVSAPRALLHGTQVKVSSKTN